MGYGKAVSYRYPKQDPGFMGRTVDVCFDFDSSATLKGKVVRCDTEEPGLMLIQLENGWVVKSTECQYSLLKT